MTHKTVPLSSLLPPRGNPRRTFDQSMIEGLAESIKTDGMLQNLVVEPVDDSYRVVTGKRRYLALKHLKRQGVIDGDYRVPVEVRKNLDETDALRIATVENVQREPLSPIDEADAFAALLQKGATVEDVSSQTGVSKSTVHRRLALASLCKEAKREVQSGDLPLSIAEAMTLGTAEQQRSILKTLKDGASFDRDDVRDMLLNGKPTAAMAVFPLDRYTGTVTSDLFADAATTYFDDVALFEKLQKEAVEQKIEGYRGKVAFIDVFHLPTVPWWQYREAEKGESAGVVINLSPLGAVEVREGLVKHEVAEEVIEETRQAPVPQRERPIFGPTLLRYIASHKSIAVQAALLANPRKAKEVAAAMLLARNEPDHPVRVIPHPSIAYFSERSEKPTGYGVIEEQARVLAQKLGLMPKKANGEAPWEHLSPSRDPRILYAAVERLSDKDLDDLVTFLAIIAFGQRDPERLDADENLFNQVAADLNVSMRAWWTPDDAFLMGLRRDQLITVAIECGASIRIGSLKGQGKHDLVRALSRYFERTADPKAPLDQYDQKGRNWLPGVMKFPAEAPVPTDAA